MERRTLIFLLAALTASFTVNPADGQKPSVYRIDRMPFNTNDFSEIAPVITGDGLVFCSDKRFSIIRDRLSFDGRRIYNIYKTGETDSVTWSKPAELNGNRNNLFNTGPFSLGPEGKTVYFTSEIETGEPAKKRSFINHSGIFIAELSGSDLQGEHPFRYNSQDYDVGQPSVSSDGKFLFFASNMPGGYGGSDLYYCELEGGEWSEPRNLGPGVNSAASESFPGSHPSGRLYFTSDRPGGPGKMDIYYTSFENGRWNDPVLLPEPLNSAADDFSLSASADLRTGYFASNRKNSDDIYRFTSTIIRKASCGVQEENSYCFRFVEENSAKFDTMPFRYDWNFGDGEKASGVVVEHCYKGPGTYIVQLDAINLVTKEISYNEKTDTLVVTNIEQAYIAGPDSMETGKLIDLNADETYLPAWNIEQYYWNFGDETVALGTRPEKVFLKPGTYNVQLIVTATSEPGMPAKETCVSKNIRIYANP